MGGLRLNRFLCNDGLERAGKILLWSQASATRDHLKRSRVVFPQETRLVAATAVLLSVRSLTGF